jgi:hypothetical protein
LLNGRIERRESLLKELQSNGIDDYELWDSVHDVKSIVATINKSHKQIVEYAMLAGFDSVTVAEDDIRFTHSNSWKYYLSQIPKDYDIFLGMAYMDWPNNDGTLRSFTGLTIYTVNSRFYETFLSVPDNEHLDRALSGLGKYIVCKPFVAKQANGFSSNTGKEENYDSLLASREFYNG